MGARSLARTAPTSAPMTQLPRTVAVVGAGTMGAGIAQVFAQAGIRVRLHDASPAALEGALTRIDASLARFVDKAAFSPADRLAIRQRITTHASLDDCADVDAVVEAIAEHRDAKTALFSRLDELCRSATLLASNTSSIAIATIGAATTRPDRVVGLHFMNPVPLMPLVELIGGAATSSATLDLARAICRALGKTAIESADTPGFIANRILMPMINEAIEALREGVGTAEAIDAVMTLGMKHPMGPLALADLIGLDVCVAILDVMHEGLGHAKYQPSPLLRDMVAAGRLGRKAGHGFYRYDR